MWQNLNLQTRMTVIVGTILFVALSSISFVTSNIAQTSAKKMAEQYIRQVGQRYAENLATSLNQAVESAEVFADAVSGQSRSGQTSRPGLMLMLKDTLKRTPEYFGTWITMLPNTIDAQDHLYSGQRGYDRNGLFTPYYTREDNVVIESFYDSDSDQAEVFWNEDYIKIPMTQQKPALIEPYIENFDGDTTKTPVMMTSAVAPVMINNKPQGVSGVDLALSNLQKQVIDIRPYKGDGSVSLVTSKGMIIAHQHSEWLGKPLEQAGLHVKHLVNGNFSELTTRDCPSINRFEVLLKEDEEGEPDHMRGF